MNRRLFLKASALVSAGGLLKAETAEKSNEFAEHGDELLVNGGFELPSIDELSQEFQLNQQQIPGWEFTGGSVRLVNHTRLLAGEGFQSLLLPCGDNKSPEVRQEFTIGLRGPVRVSLKLVASKAVDGEIEVLLDNRAVKAIRIPEFWNPEDIALTDQMQWRIFALPETQMTPGKHTLGIRVLKFRRRNDRQGDKRDIIQGVLVDAVSVAMGAPTTNSEPMHPWPTESEQTFKVNGPLPLDGVAGPWVSTRTLASYPSLANFFGAVRSTKELGGLQYLHFCDIGSVESVLNVVSLDGRPVFCDESRWFPYQICTRAQVGLLDIEATTRMVFSGHWVLTRLVLTNRSNQSVVRTLEMNLRSGELSKCSDPCLVMLAGLLPRAYRFAIVPDQVVARNKSNFAKWQLSLASHATYEISLAMTMARTPAQALENTQLSGRAFSASFSAAKASWEKRWQDVFTPGNAIYSGSLPVLETSDELLRELYYLSIASLLQTERDNFPLFKQCFVAATPEWCRKKGYFWDLSLTSLPYALLNPSAMKEELRHWLTIDWRTCNSIDFEHGEKSDQWYAVNAYAYFLTLDRYLTVTRDFAFLAEVTQGKNVLDYMLALAMDWKRLVPDHGRLADIGGNCWNMLEAPPDYIHTVASINAANIWMMRRLADYQSQFGHPGQAVALRAEANALVAEVLKLYNQSTGSWFVLYPDGRKIDSRHVYDYLTVGTTISDDLSPEIKAGMMNFVERELLTKSWMRAMSRHDPSALESDRSDHGPAGSYSGWPAKAGQATAELGRFDKALEMFHRFRGAFDSAIPQAIELTRVEGKDDLQTRVSTRAGASFAEVSGSFAEVIINTFFGFRPTPDGTTALWNPEASRGFDGRLRHVRWNDDLYTIVSDKRGLHLEKE